MHSNAAIRTDRLERGVYYANFAVDDKPFVYCVDSRGNGRKLIRLSERVTEDMAVRKLRAWLDEHDPVPQLRLVVDVSNESAPLPWYIRDPKTDPVEPKEVYWQRLAHAGGQKWKRYR